MLDINLQSRPRRTRPTRTRGNTMSSKMCTLYNSSLESSSVSHYTKPLYLICRVVLHMVFVNRTRDATYKKNGVSKARHESTKPTASHKSYAHAGKHNVSQNVRALQQIKVVLFHNAIALDQIVSNCTMGNVAETSVMNCAFFFHFKNEN
jgi:hypothetical protein